MPDPAQVTAQPDILARLQACLADLEGYVRREAEKLAEPMIERARAEAAEHVREARRELERRNDVLDELRRRLTPLQRQADEAAEARDRLAKALGHHPLGRFLPGLVAEAETALAGRGDHD